MSLGIYIQVPFCQTKCTYCNFHTGIFSSSLYAPYVDAVCREIRDHAALYAPAGIAPVVAQASRPVHEGGGQRAAQARTPVLQADSSYLGGGTPSLLDPAALARILESVRRTFSVGDSAPVGANFSSPAMGEMRAPACEVTLEADPETVTAEKAAAWRDAGINRVSLGVQSFHDQELRAAGRMHRRADIFTAVAHLRAAGLTNISFDLIAGLPHQTAASWAASLEELVALRPEHVSIYLLEIDEGSRLGRAALLGLDKYGAGALPAEDDMAAFYEAACARLAAAGYEHYEISNWARVVQASRPVPQNPGAASSAPTKASPGEQTFCSRHNLKYWRREPYLGFGAGAHSFNGAQRWANVHDPAAYVAAIEQGRLPVEQLEAVTPQQALDEELFLGLRQLAGIDLTRIEREYHVALGPRIAPLREAGLVELEGTTLRLAPAKLAVSNEVFVELLR